MILKKVPSGIIEIVESDEGDPLLQFNCECIDALPWCKAACCRGRPQWNSGVYPDELEKFETLDIEVEDGIKLLKFIKNRCWYLGKDDNLCGTHPDKPRICKEWHCSPGGKGEDIKLRSNGWKLEISTLTGM